VVIIGGLRLNIGLIGKLGSGKTFAANYLVDRYEFAKYSLADPIKTIMKEYLGIESKEDPLYRMAAQKIGTDCFRAIDDLVWVKYLQKRVERSMLGVVVDDVRFVNEVEAMLNWGWVLICLECPDQVRVERCIKRDGVFDPSRMTHPSETGVDDILRLFGDKIITIDASKSPEYTNQQLDKVLSSV
jgi:dephospho-CoA kinase